MGKDKMEYLYGYYDFGSYRLINPLNSTKDLIEGSTDIHELMHFLLSAKSSYGMLLYALAKIKRSNEWKFFSDDTKSRHESMVSYLNKASLKVQEGLAVFYQWVYYRLFWGNGSEEEFLKYLKHNNREYYKYLEPIVFIINALKESTDEEIDLSSVAFFEFCVDCMNVSIKELDENKIYSKGKYDNYSSHDKNALSVVPNVIFKNKLKVLRDKLYSSAEPVSGNIKSLIGETVLNRNTADIEAESYIIKAYVLKLYQKSDDIKIISRLLDEIKPQEKTVEEVAFSELPLSFGYRDMNIIDSNEFELKVFEEKKPSLTILIMKNVFLKGYSDNIIKLNEFFSELYEKSSIVVLFDLSKRKLYKTNINDCILRNVLGDVESPINIVVNYKAYDYKNERIINLGECRHNLYIYCDRSFYNTREYINKFNKKGINYTALRYHSLYIVVFRLNDNTCFFVPVLSRVFPLAIRMLEEDYPNFVNCIVENPVDGCVIRDVKEKREFDIMVSNLYFIDIDPKDPYYRSKCKHVVIEY